MMESSDFRGHVGVWPPEPRSVLDAGGETSAFLSGSLHRCVATMELGQVLEVISREPCSRIEVPEWCRMSGHKLLHVVEHGDETLFWIRKR
jgi:TusA-related sulfurtransferase